MPEHSFHGRWRAPPAPRCSGLHPRARQIPLNVIKTVCNPPASGSQRQSPPPGHPAPCGLTCVLPHPATPPFCSLPCSSHTGPRLFRQARHARLRTLALAPEQTSACSVLPHRRPRGSLGPSGKPFIRTYCAVAWVMPWIQARLRHCSSWPCRTPAGRGLFSLCVYFLFWLCWVFMTVWLFLPAVSRGSSPVMLRLLIAGASLVEHTSRGLGLSSRGSWAPAHRLSCGARD